MKRYRTGLVDPPWNERGGGKVKRGADRWYPTMSTAPICALPAAQLFENDAHLYLWATNNYLPDAFEVMKAWNFRYVTCITWGKVSEGKVQTGLGQYYRGSSEHLLFGVRGSIPYRLTPEGKRAQGQTLYLAPRGEHSTKPEGFRHVIEKVSPGPYVELFARRPTPGWDVWGNEVASSPDAAAVMGTSCVCGGIIDHVECPACGAPAGPDCCRADCREGYDLGLWS